MGHMLIAMKGTKASHPVLLTEDAYQATGVPAWIKDRMRHIYCVYKKKGNKSHRTLLMLANKLLLRHPATTKSSCTATSSHLSRVSLSRLGTQVRRGMPLPPGLFARLSELCRRSVRVLTFKASKVCAATKQKGTGPGAALDEEIKFE